MSPGDQPWVAKEMIEAWAASVLDATDLRTSADEEQPAGNAAGQLSNGISSA